MTQAQRSTGWEIFITFTVVLVIAVGFAYSNAQRGATGIAIAASWQEAGICKEVSAKDYLMGKVVTCTPKPNVTCEQVMKVAAQTPGWDNGGASCLEPAH